jgi:hypothetical protein
MDVRRLTSLYDIQFAPHRKHPMLVVKPADCHRSIYLLWDGKQLNNIKNCGISVVYLTVSFVSNGL